MYCTRWFFSYYHPRVPLWVLHPHAPDYVWNKKSEMTTHRIGTANAVGEVAKPTRAQTANSTKERIDDRKAANKSIS